MKNFLRMVLYGFAIALGSILAKIFINFISDPVKRAEIKKKFKIEKH